ncbi:MAG: hypothetical protein QXH17_06250, partial [Candidatus Bathyarchaeia archaeon]
GWNFAAGPVLYWVVSALYSVVQQWLITGWGAMLDWFPFLPDLPEHRRLGYLDPAKREAQRQATTYNSIGVRSSMARDSLQNSGTPPDSYIQT